MYVYKITNNVNNKIYIGKSTYEPNETSHYYGSGVLIKNAIKKYGKDNFTKEILYECVTIDELNKQEKYWILELNSTDKTIGYNLSHGGDGGDTITMHPERNRIRREKSEWNKIYWTEERKKERSIKNTGENNPFKNKHHSTETKNKISQKKKNIPYSSERNQRISETLKRKYDSGEIVKVVSQETKEKMSKLHIGMYHKEETKQKIKEKMTGENNPASKEWLFINEDQSFIVRGCFHQFCIEHDLSISAMRSIADGTRKNKYYNNWTVIKK